jgi:hypothetical protein
MSKLGRNPLDKVKEKKERTLPALETVQGPQLPFIEKVKELQIQVDWEELYRATVENKLKGISRFFLRF